MPATRSRITEEIVLRAGRFLEGRSRPDDLDRLFLFLRSTAPRNSLVGDLGDLVAHRHEKDKGVVFNFSHASFWSMYLATRRIASDNEADFLRYPPEILRESAWGTVRVFGSESRKQFGVTSSDAEKIIDRVCSQLALAKAGMHQNIAYEDWETFTSILSISRVRCEFSDDQLVNEFIRVAMGTQLYRGNAPRYIRAQRQYLAAWATALMHGCVVELGHGQQGMLRARATPSDEIAIFMEADVIPERNLSLGLPVLRTRLSAQETIVDAPPLADGMTWGPLELTDGGRLRPIA